MLNLLLFLGLSVQPQEVDLSRTFTTGQTLTYQVKAHIFSEVKTAEYSFFLPEEFDVNYVFTLKAQEARKDGFATVVYERPTMTFIEGETAEHPPKTKVENVGYKYQLTLSPINEVTDQKDLNPKKEKPGKSLYATVGARTWSQENFIGKMISELHSLAMFTGSLDSSLDFAPTLPIDTVKPGSTWKKTVSYQPRVIKGTEKQAIQRLDYVYKYEGLIESNGIKVHRVTATLELDTDAALFINQMMGTKPEESGLKELRLNLKTNISFDLDEKTRVTLSAMANSMGGFKIMTTENGDVPVVEEKLKGTTTLNLTSIK